MFASDDDVGIILNGDKSLAERRKTDEKTDPDIVYLPGDHGKRNENTQVALKREMRKELGIEVKEMRLV